MSDVTGAPPAAAPNPVLLVLTALAAAVMLGLPLVSVQPNRIMPGEGLTLWALGGPLALAGVLILLAALAWLGWRPTRRALATALALVGLCLALLPWGLVAVAAEQIDPDMASARIGLGAGLWALLFVLLLALLELLNRLTLAPLPRWGLTLVLALSLFAALASGGLDSLALMREYHGRSAAFHAALRYHLLLVAAVVGISLLLAAALALAMRRWAGLRRGTFSVLSVLQTIPSLALFGLLLAPLAYLAARFTWLGDLGIRGIGWAPAFIALVAYSLLPMTRNAFVALDEVAADVTDAARGMGMSPAQVFWQVRLPLALPVMLEGIRITAVQAIGLAAVAALIGAGGLGTFIFQGLGQAAMDLVLLGALPIILIALLVDGAFSALAEQLRRAQGRGDAHG
ncbi:ABC transporter permease [Franzmannia qiaohouensis]|uniref:ABC transporter permease n=1 Tax=Franzmannia qiaohouensis TaxID=1329370 RepID=A0ABU1HEW7_9GAMM|nr:ABC transporter permease [Halomonas qiaohouensis]MDR5906021.1 ABC transporter permease [Halomonas qiaohouensis]